MLLGLGGGMKLRAVLCSMLGALALSACAPIAEREVILPEMQAPTAEEAAQARCFVQSLYDESWAPAYAGREAQCFRDDSCFGGLGQASSDGRPLCHKWAIAPDAPALRWSPALTHPRVIGPDIPPPEPIYEGEFEATNDCVNETCTPPPIRFNVATLLYAEPDASSAVVSTIPVGECVQPSEYRLRAAPLRGIVLETTDRFEAGEVIYQLAYQGEGYVGLWRRGEMSDFYIDDVVVRWDPPPATPHPAEGFWLRLTRADGASGWARNADGINEGCSG